MRTRMGSGGVARAAAVLLAVVLLTLGMAVPALADDLPVGSDEDVTPAAIASLDVAPTSVDVRTSPATVTVTARLTDDLSGVDRALVYYQSPTNRNRFSVNLVAELRTSGSALDGTYVATASISTGVEPGTYTPWSATTWDTVGNQRGYTGAELTALGAPNVVVQSNQTDTTAPVVTAVRITPSPIDVRGGDVVPLVEFDVDDDGGTGLLQAAISLSSPSGRQFLQGTASYLDLVAGTGTAAAGTFRGKVNSSTSTPAANAFEPGLSQYSEPGQWRVNYVQVYDQAFNSRVYQGAELAAVTAAEITVVSDPVDTEAPTLSAFRFSPAAIDVTAGPATVAVELDVADDLAGVQAAWLTFRSPTVPTLSPPSLQRSAVHHSYLTEPRFTGGTLTGSITFPKHDRGGAWQVSEVCVIDRVKWLQCYAGTDLDPLGPTEIEVVVNEPPVVTVLGPADGATYEASSVPAAGCRVEDAEDGVRTDVVPTVVGPDDDGVVTVTCSTTDTGGKPGSASVTYTVVGDPEPPAPPAPTDSDGDGVYDVIEIWIGCNPHDADTDHDGIDDHTEILLGTDPTRVDTHGDPDFPDDGSWLTHVHGHLCGCGPHDDDDHDGVVNWVEIHWGTDPGSPDSDGPGGFGGDVELVWHRCGCGPHFDPDGGVPPMVRNHWGGGGILEILHRCGCRPWADPAGGGIGIDWVRIGGPAGDAGDPDGDGIPSEIEVWIGCNPNDPDTDGDGFEDGEDPDPLVAHQARISVDDVTVIEGDPPTAPPATFTVSLDGPSRRPVTVRWEAVAGTATTPADWTAGPGGVLTFAPGETARTVTATVVGDLVDEPDETFVLRLSDPTGAVVVDGEGVGTILDDERDGAFTCRATGLRLVTIELAAAQGPGGACADQDRSVASASVSLLGLGVDLGVARASTDEAGGSATPAVGDHGRAESSLTGLKVRLGLVSITADAVRSSVEAVCASPLGGAPTVTSSSSVTNLRVGGKAIAVGTAPIDVPVPGIGVLHVNHRGAAGASVTVRALWLEGQGLLAPVQLVVAESTAGATGNPCTE